MTTTTALWITAEVMTLNGLLDLVEPFVIFKKKQRPAYRLTRISKR